MTLQSQTIPVGGESNPTPLNRLVIPALRAKSNVHDRVAMFDAVRVFAAVGVIYFHSIGSDDLRASGILGRFSVAFYTMAAMIFLVQGILRHPERGLWDYFSTRFKRLYLPFIGWSILTQISMKLLHLLDSKVEVPDLNWNVLITGLALPLWFIPFVLIGGVLIFPLAKWVVGHKRRELWVMLAAVLVGLLLDWVKWKDPPQFNLPIVDKLLEMSWHRWSSLFWGLGLALAYFRWFKNSRWSSLLAAGGVLALAIIVVVMFNQWVTGLDVARLKVMGGLAACLIAFAPWQNKCITRLGQLAPLSFGMYMSHSLWITMGQMIIRYLDWPSCWQADIFVFLFAVATSLVTIRILASMSKLVWLSGNDKGVIPFRRVPQPVAVSI